MKVTLKSELTKEKERLMSRLSELDPIEDKQEYAILGTFGSILLIMNYERDNILNAKAFSFVKKP